MKNFIVFLWIGMMIGVLYAEELQCYSYDPQHFIASGESKSSVKSIEAVYVVKLPKIRKKNFQNYVGVAVKAAGKIYQNHHLDCEAEKGRYYCSGECDSGQVWLDKKNRLMLEFVNYSEVRDYGNGLGGPVTLLDLRPKDEKVWIEGKKIACPDEVKQGNYICYGSKDEKQYYSCERSISSCQSNGKKHFGKYPDESSTRAALMRCFSKKPKK
ncbi:hypothetical protein YH65_08210 [Sulfurovum lithotrophicum]|uniref:Uncharacterized protein n=1 Tax=Sulfurovum lithotrophicum TaxID=206403 RepID=A0A7U4RR35_9BACT|nr:hypothetical protein [Sulfurovum lithotrophicum]AKF25372.1 hypothetical protein YH65_08210 [Sulfurovum lithotrophicum]